jgi:hypothetical protein
VLALLLAASPALAKKDDQPKKQKDQPQDQAANDKQDQQKVKLTGDQRWMQNIHDQLQPTDGEWMALQPRIDTILRLQREINSGHDPKGPREPKPQKISTSENPEKPTPQILALTRDLVTTLFDQAAATADLRRKVAAVREARAKVRHDLTMAQEDLRQLLTYRQEAVLIVMGILE